MDATTSTDPPRDIWAELAATLALAAPLAAGNLAQMAMGFTDTVMVGRLGAVALAAAGLGGMLYFTTGVVLQGVISAVSPLAAHAVGTGDRTGAGRIAGAGFALALLLSLPFLLAVTMLDRLLAALGYPGAVTIEIGRFLSAITWGAPAFLGFAALRSLLAALAHTRAVMLVLVTCVGANLALNWVLVFGHLGAPALGVAGSGYASAINQWLILIGLALYVGGAPSLRGLRVLRGALLPRMHELVRILRLGLPIGGIMGLEIGVFLAAGVLIGLLGADALGAHQLVLNCAGLTFMVPLGVSQAATVRIAYELGAGRPAAARRAGVVALAIGVAFMGATALVLWSAPRAIVAIYVDVGAAANAGLVPIALSLLAIAAAFQVFDGVQVIAAGALRGYEDTTVPMLLGALGYWGFGFGGGWLLAFPLGYGVRGLWWGLALGLAAVAVLLALRLRRLATKPVDT
ncbi:MAG TPA: MATE family efflux transporter [Candidatus Sulfotelmatobacter sp.]|nr:MATE family efflux transporter [Candidatus Sulfotelmatobacter sp.]